MLTAQWSPELPNIMNSLRQLAPRELVSRLKDSHFIDSWNVNASERKAIMKAFSGNEEAGSNIEGPATFWSV